MTLYTFTLDSGRGLLGVAGLQIKGGFILPQAEVAVGNL